ncbi:fructose-1-phosphate kinase [Mycoplasmopsis mustelae]|uniref:Fructose-1-phosphate kinase n=1 Tax=Mycoplasmopsis mustelae TaxID=171289 RepID=A0A4R7UDM8_9BACT|nr:1-phosphofructokinase family hexose kinase [Mycoplasmopsis mustelae]TDV23540.1 fructose-1-phosphate kinase [Mycoplasmopsis mustelae]
MIYTLTLSPSLDLLIKGNEFQVSKVNRYQQMHAFAGGKGINASIILSRHRIDNVAITLFDSKTFLDLKNVFDAEKLYILNIPVNNKTRVNIKFMSDKTSFELNGPRADLDQEHISKVLKILEKMQSNDVFMLMGTAKEEHLLEILQFCYKKQVKIVLDVESKNFFDLLKYQPYLIKPNIDELAKLFPNQTLNNFVEIKLCVDELKAYGAQNVIVSLGGEGSYLFTKDNQILYASNLKKITPVSTAGAGDTMTAIFAAEYIKTNDAVVSLKRASAAALATVSDLWLGNETTTQANYDSIKIEIIKE